MTMTPQFTDMMLLSYFFDVVLFLLSSLVTGPSLMSISLLILKLWKFFFYKRLNRNLEIGLTPFSFLANIWKQERFRDTNFGTNVSNKKFLDRTKCQGYSFYCFWVIKKNSTGDRGGGGIKLSHPRPSLLRLNIFCKEYNLFKDRSTLVFS